MKINNPTLKAQFEISEKKFYERKAQEISDEIDREIIRILLETAKGNKIESDLIPFKSKKII